ncbi:MAG: hypothetical protein DMD89_29425 [Candidatus Rokuibacteriota bacterium]|nr:MAG: hypothetical protein DMD89_29425 [Candidatus Rokubacteria bacterium]
MVDAMPAQEPDATAVLEGQDPPAVDLLLVDRLATSVASIAVTLESTGGQYARGSGRQQDWAC